MWVRHVLAEVKTKLAVCVNRHSLWYFSALITRKLTASQTWHWMRFLASVSFTTNLFNMLLVFDKSSCDSLSSAIEKCQAWVLISKSCYSNDGERKSMEKRTKSQCAVFSISLKDVKVLCLKKGMMNVHYPFIMYEATNCFRALCSATRRSWIFEKPGEWKSILVSLPNTPHPI